MDNDDRSVILSLTPSMVDIQFFLYFVFSKLVKSHFKGMLRFVKKKLVQGRKAVWNLSMMIPMVRAGYFHIHTAIIIYNSCVKNNVIYFALNCNKVILFA